MNWNKYNSFKSTRTKNWRCDSLQISTSKKEVYHRIGKDMFSNVSRVSTREFRTNVTKSICATTLITLLLFNLLVEQQKKRNWSNEKGSEFKLNCQTDLGKFRELIWQITNKNLGFNDKKVRLLKWQYCFYHLCNKIQLIYCKPKIFKKLKAT